MRGTYFKTGVPMNPGQRIDRFIIERLLGRGGMAEVYLARDTQLARRVALKRLRGERDDATSTVRFLREARFASAFHHPCAVTVYDIFEHENQPYIAMEYVEGKTLRALVGDATVPADRRIRWLVDAARALGAAHRAGLVHRDVKPHNIMVTEDGRVKVLDFGIARIDRASGVELGGDADDDSLPGITQTGAIVGTPLYSSPEQLSGQAVDSRSDQFSWALTAYELLCGYLPWRRRDAMTVLAQLVADDVPSMGERLKEILEESRDTARLSEPGARFSDTGQSAPPPPPDPALFEGVPLGVEPVLACALSRDPDKRFPTIDDAADALEEYAEDPRSIAGNWRTLHAVSMPPLGALPTPAPSPSPPKPISSGGSSNATPGRTGGTKSAQDILAARLRSGGPLTARKPFGAPPTDGLGSSPTPARVTPQPSSSSPIQASSVVPSRPTQPTGDGHEALLNAGLLDAPPYDPRASSPTLRASGTPPPLPKRAAWWRRPVTTAAAAGVALLGAMLGLSRLIETAPPSSRGATSGAATPTAASSSEIARVSCGPAEVRGSIDAPNAAAVLGSAACVRLAVELGVDWSAAPSDAPLRVTIETSSGPVKATLALRGAESHGEGPKPIDAIQAAMAPLVGALRAPALPASARAAWGASSPDAASRALREVRRVGLLLSPDPRVELARWADADPHTPWPWVLLAGATVDGDPTSAQGRTKALPLADALPPERAAVARGWLLMRAPAVAGDAAEGLRKLRRAYAVAPDDPEVQAVLAAALFRAGRPDEALPVARRLFSQPSPASLAWLVVASDTDRDPQWIEERGRLLDALEAWLPEARAWPSRVRYELSAGHIDAATKSVDLGVALGLPSASRFGDLSRAWIALERLDTAAARKLGRPLVMSPDPAVSDEAVRLLVQAFLLEGKSADAETELARDIERQIALGNEPLLAARYAWLLSICRRLAEPAPSFIEVDKLRALAEKLAAHDDPASLQLEAELAALLIETGAEKPAAAEALLTRAGAFAARVAQGDRAVHDAVLSVASPLEAAVRPAPKALEWHRALDKAPYSWRLRQMFTLGDLCEQSGDATCAEASFREAARSPGATDGLEYISARLRLAKIVEKKGDAPGAAALRDPVTALVAGADPAVTRLIERRAR
ncbi:MAG: protein kinase [Polyangiaceae bacterium]